jgi:hypothetical protein
MWVNLLKRGCHPPYQLKAEHVHEEVKEIFGPEEESGLEAYLPPMDESS